MFIFLNKYNKSILITINQLNTINKLFYVLNNVFESGNLKKIYKL